MTPEQLEESDSLLIDFTRFRTPAGVGIVPVAVQDADTKDVLLVGHASAQALDYTLTHRVAAFWSVSRNELWIKGQTSGNRLDLVEVRVNCEQNSLLYLVRLARGGACHTRESSGEARRSCYYRRIRDGRLEPVLRVSLRPLDLRDAEEVQRYAADERVAATCNVPHPYPEGAGVQFAQRCVRDREAGLRFPSAVLVDGRFAGVMGLNAVDRQTGTAELDYWIAAPFWGKGVATAAAKLAVELAFRELGLRTLYSGCWMGNPASGRVLQKAGFTEIEPVINEGLYGQKFHGQTIRRFCLDREASASSSSGEPAALETTAGSPLLADDLIELRLLRVMGPEHAEQRPPEARFLSPAIEYRYAIHRRSNGLRVGRIHLRITSDPLIVRAMGHAGYAVDEAHRRQGYASRALRLLLGLARHHGVASLWILIEPDNAASRRTAERAGLRYVDTVDALPEAIALGHGKKLCRYVIESPWGIRVPVCVSDSEGRSSSIPDIGAACTSCR